MCEGGVSVDGKENISEYLMSRAKYARACRDREIMHEVYGEAKMARKLDAISKETFMELNEILVRNGINKPSSYD